MTEQDLNEQPLEAGKEAPDFTLKVTSDQTVSLRDYRGRPVVLVFYPADWSPVCGDQLALYNELLPEFKKFNAEVIGISVDGVWSHQAFVKDRNLHFTLLSDFEPKGEIAKAYQVYDNQKGRAKRALFVIDAQGKIFWSYVSPSGANPGADGILNALESLASTEKTHG